jgi:hypothetical protein
MNVYIHESDSVKYFPTRDPLVGKVAGRHKLGNHPRRSGKKVLRLWQNSRYTVSGRGDSIYLQLPSSFNSPGPRYRVVQFFELRYRVDSGAWTTVTAYGPQRIIPLIEKNGNRSHRVTIEAITETASISGIIFSEKPVSQVRGKLFCPQFNEYFTNVRVDVYSHGKVIGTEYVRNPFDGTVELLGLPPGKYRLKFLAAGWDSLETEVQVRREGEMVDLGVLVLNRRQGFEPRGISLATGYGRTVNSGPGFIAKCITPLLRIGTGESKFLEKRPQAFLVSKFKRIPVAVARFKRVPTPIFDGLAWIHIKIPKKTPHDMYALELLFRSGREKGIVFLGQAVCVREKLPQRFSLAAVGHMNTSGQKMAEYLKMVSEMVELAGARAFLVSNEVSGAYVSGALSDLSIPYVATGGNHVMSGWEHFFGSHTYAYDDGPMRVVAHGKFGFDSWAEVESLFKERQEAKIRILTCFEDFAPQGLIHRYRPTFVFHSRALRKTKETPCTQIKASGQDAACWIPIVNQMIDSRVKTSKDILILDVSRWKTTPPLRVAYSTPNDGRSSKSMATIINEYPTAFEEARVRFLMKPGRYRTDHGKIVQQFPSDFKNLSVVDLRVAVPAKASAGITISAV